MKEVSICINDFKKENYEKMFISIKLLIVDIIMKTSFVYTYYTHFSNDVAQ